MENANKNKPKITDNELLRADVTNQIKRELDLLKRVEKLKTILEKGREI